MSKFIITALDIGTSKICAVIASYVEDAKLEVKGIGWSESDGLDKGVVKDIQTASESIRKAIEDAESQARCNAENIFMGITGEHIRSINTIGRISISGPLGNEPSEIQQEHVDQVLEDAKKSIRIQKGMERLEILHAIPQFYEIDGQDSIQNPINMSGFHLTAHVNIILADITAIRNLKKCVELAGYEVDDVVLEHVACSMAVLTDIEKNLGCVLIDLGGGTSDISIFYQNSLFSTYVVPAGGNNITNDLAIGLRTTPKFAEYLKIEYGNCQAQTVDENQEVIVEGISGRSSTSQKTRHIAMIIQHRMDEILAQCYRTAIQNYLPDRLTAGVVLTGGSALIKNTADLAVGIFDLPVKIGYPDISKLSGPISRMEDPQYSTVIGLLYYAMEQDFNLKQASGMSKIPKLSFQKIIDFFKEFK
ncbi:MAG TPA: cell division protein FtsA [Candidatus Cloacimonadota bacterium]|nr:cell division protein FtsA [Candidatus Cloacimonadota bacterium]